MNPKRYSEIDIAKAIAIILVVYHHVVSGNPFPIKEKVFVDIYDVIIKIDIPLFYFLAGITFDVSFSKFRSRGFIGRIDFIKNKCIRLLPSYLVMSVVLFSIVAIFGKLINKDIGALTDYFKYLLYPRQAVIWYLWFLHLLMLFYITFPFIIKITKDNEILILLTTIFISFLPFSELFNLKAYADNIIFFSLGYLFYKQYFNNIKLVYKYNIVLIIIFIISIFIYNSIPTKVFSLIGITSIFAISLTNKLQHINLLLVIGQNTLTIYLFNLFFISILKLVINKYLGLSNIPMIIYVLLLIMSGLFGPLLLKVYIFSKNKILNNYF